MELRGEAPDYGFDDPWIIGCVIVDNQIFLAIFIGLMS